MGKVQTWGRDLEKGRKEVEGRILEVLEEVEKGRGEGNIKRRWWDEECRMKKREVRKELREWRKGRGDGREYRERRREYREFCERKKKEDNEKWEKKVTEARRESEVWEVVNKERRKTRRVDEGIKRGEWEEYFMGLLGGG